MTKLTIITSVLCLLMIACNNNGGGSKSPGVGGGSNNDPNNKGVVSDWQNSLLGQEGHGGDAVVCFSIPIERALYKVNTNPGKKCQPGENCPKSVGMADPMNPGSSSSGIVWRLTNEGRQSIQSAKPLEQYLGERISSKKILIDQLNQMPLEEGYQQTLQPFTKLPSAFNRIAEMHRKLGWLHEDGIASEYGLIDINDSGFVNENEIDQTRCKELQAVVRRDNQLWYDADIVKHFDNAGRVLIQLHEEIYAWGKLQDQINWKIQGRVAHETSTKTRRLILKILDHDMDEKLVNENLKGLGFSIMFWENLFSIPTSVGFYMDTDTCIAEQKFLKEFFKSNQGNESAFSRKVANLFLSRYLNSDNDGSRIELQHNYPDALSNMISMTLSHAHSSNHFAAEILKLQRIFEQPESCQGSF